MARGPYLREYDDGFFREPFKSKPISKEEWASLLGVPKNSASSHLREHRPYLWREVEQEINKNRDEIASQRFQEKESRVETQKQLEDPSTLTGRKILNLEERNKDLHTQLRNLQDQVYSQRQFVDEVAAASTEPLERPNYKVRRGASTTKEERAVLLPIFDMQVGTLVVPDDTIGGLGAFNSEILKQRAERYVEVVAKIIHAQSQNFRIGPLVFALGGDMVEGDEIFDDQSWQLEIPSPDQVILARDTLTWIIDGIIQAGAEAGAKMASVLCVPGNHGRRGKKRSGRHKSDSFDILVYRLLEERLKNYPIFTFATETAGNCAFEVLKNRFAMLHGDEIRGWGGLPFYGITRADARNIRTLNYIPDYVLMGHHHQPGSLPVGYGEWLLSGNWVGATNQSRDVGSNVPQQALFMVDEERGVPTREAILLDKKRRPTPVVHQTS